jgi:peptidoglycan hydrolase-like protein with peptidoglycan-binding domain
MSVLKRGSSGPEVKDLQEKLKELGFDPNGVDGNFGPGTESAVRAFQNSKGLDADGKAGPNTIAAIQSASGAGGGGGAAGGAGAETATSTASAAGGAVSANSQKRLDKVHPKLAQAVAAVINNLAAEGLKVEVTQGLRTFAEQDALFAQGRTKPGKKVTKARGGQSNHNYGLAIDLCPFIGTQPQWEDEKGFDRIGAAAKQQGLKWGGDWPNFPDRPHVELAGPSVNECLALFNNGGLAKVWAKIP